MPKKNLIHNQGNTLIVEINVMLLIEGDQFVAYCPALELSSYGESEEIAKKRFEEEINIFFEETAKKGTLEKYLLKMGWTLRMKPQPKYTPPKRFPSEKQFNKLTTFSENVEIPVC